MKVRKEIVTLGVIICLLLQIVSSSFVTVHGKSSNKLVVSGKIKVEIKDFTSGSTIKKRQNLENYPVILYYEDSKGDTKQMDIVTDDLGSYKVILTSQSAIKKVWLKVNAENKACVVYSKFRKWDGHTKYEFKNKAVSVNSDSQSYLTMNYTIRGKDAGAVNIARVINNARAYVDNNSGLVASKVPVIWSYGRGAGSYEFEFLDTVQFIALSGEDQDEFDSSVICHEYGHWIFNTLRNGNFRGGNHSSSKNIDSRLAYSEGLATYFGQMALNSEIYYDGNDKNTCISTSLEDPKIIYPKLNGLQNEVYVAAALWDITDIYNQSEKWDKFNERKEYVFWGNRDAIVAADLITDIKKPIEIFNAFDIDLKDFYKKYIEKHITPNSDEAYDFWSIFKENHMQLDNKNPNIKIAISNNELNIQLYDNVKVSKAEIYINGKKDSTINEPSDNISYKIPVKKLSVGLNKITVKAYDYAGNEKSKIKLKQYNIYTDSPDKTLVGTCYQPYTVSYCDYFYEGENEPTTFSVDSMEDVDDDRSIIKELADLYGLVCEVSVQENLLSEEISETRKINITKGNDFSLFVDDTLGNYEILLTDPNGVVYNNSEISEADSVDETGDEVTGNTTSDIEIQNVLNLGSRGLAIFYPTVGTWTYTIRNKGTDGNYSLGIYTKMSAPVIENEENLVKIQDGSNVDIKGSIAIKDYPVKDSEVPAVVATGSAIIVDTDEKPTLTTGVHIKLIDDAGDVLVENTIVDGINENGEFTYTFNNLEDGHYYLEIYSLRSDGASSWTRTSEIVVNSKEPDIQLDDDYEYYIYSKEAILSGIINNADTIDISVNGQSVAYDGESKVEDSFSFGCNIDLIDGDNYVIITAKSETGKVTTKELVLHSIEEEDYLQENHQPEIDTVTFNGGNDSTINGKSTIEVRLTDKNVSDYKVYAVCNDQIYDFVPIEDHYTLDFIPSDYDNESYDFTVCVISKWQFYNEKEYEIHVVGNEEKLHIKNEPEDIYLCVDETATLDLNDIFGECNYNVEANYGTVKGNIWSFTSAEQGEYEIRLKAFDKDIEKEVIFEVVFEPSKEHKIEFRTNGGEIEETDYYVVEGDEYGELPVTTKKGYEFLGWFDKEKGGEQILDSTIVKESDFYILYAHWKGKEITINFNPNGGNVEVGSKIVVYNEEYGNLPIPTKQNCEFIGWYSGPKGGVRITPESIVSKMETQTLYAQWKENNYQVSFDSNGGILEEQTLFVKKGEKYGTLPIPVREGYTFKGWYTAKTNGVLIQSTTTVTATSNHVLYALWDAKGYTVSFNYTGGQVKINNKIYTTSEGTYYYDKVYGTLPAPTKNGYVFAGWYTKEEGGELITASSIVKITNNQTLYAHWKEGEYQVYFNPNGGSVGINGKKVTYMNEYGDLPVPKRENYIFVGWSILNTSESLINEKSQVKTANTHTLYAIWKGISYEVTFDANGGETTVNIKKVVFGEEYGELPIPMRKGYHFWWWCYTKTGGTNIASTTKVSIGNDHTLYAYWTAESYKTVFDPNGGKIIVGKSEYDEYTNYYSYDQKYQNLLTTTRAGYEFIGWYTEKEGGDLVTVDSIVNVAGEQRLYAHWKEGEYQVYFNPNGGSVEINSKKVTYMSEYGDLPVPRREGYIFVGWSTLNTSESLINEKSQVKTANTHTLYAIWKGISYEVTFDANGGETTVNNKKVVFGEGYGELPIPVRKGYHFWWWCYTKTGGTNVNSTTKVNIGNDHTLYAYWTPESYKTVFDPNGGKIKVGNSEYNEYTNYYNYNQKYQSLLTPTRAGYEFIGWHTEKEGGELVTVDSIVSVAGEQRLYAHWKAATFKVIFHPNGGVVSTYDKEVTYKEKYGNLPVSTREGYSFVEWRTAGLYGGEVITADSEVAITSTHYIYAQWKANSYTVTFNPEGGKLLNYHKEVEFAGAYGELPIPTRNGYIFTGWVNREPGGGNVTGTTIMWTAKNHTLYAMWSPQSYTRTFDCTGGKYGSYSTYDKVYYFDKEYGTLIIPTKLGYEFVGWFTQEIGGEQITNTSIIDVAEAQTLYAHWKPASYTIYFNANGGINSVNDSTKIVTYKGYYGTLPIPTRERYEFVGWFTQSSGGTQITSMTQVEITGTQTLYARWIGKTYNLYFNSNGGSCSVNNKSIVYYEKYGDLPTPTKIGYNFSGWYTDITSGYAVNKDTIVTMDQDQILYARWTPVYYTVTFVANGGTVPYNSISVILGEQYGPLPTPYRQGYTFLYWYRINGDTIEIVNENSIVPRDNSEYRYLYARWIQN